MNILVLNWRDIKHPRAGGAEVRLHHVYEPIAQAGHRVILITSTFENSQPMEDINGIEVHRFGNDKSFAPLCTKNLPKWIEEFAIDIVVEDFNKLPLLSPMRVKKPLLIQMHHLWKTSIFHETIFPVALFIWLTEQTLRFVYRKQKFCVVSDSTKKELHSMGVSNDNIDIIYNGVALDFYTAQKNQKREMSLLWLSRIQKYKGVMDACEAFKNIAAKYPNLTLNIAGNGPYKAEVIEWIKKENLSDRIKLLGFVSEEEKRELMQTSMALIQSSYKEGWGLTVIEANACGTPVIANNAPGLCDSVQDGETGLLYNFGSVASLTAKIEEILDNRELHQKLSSNCRAWAEKFTWRGASEETLQLLEKVIKNHEI